MSDTASPPGGARAEALRTRRRLRRLRIGAIAAAALVGVTLFALVATDTLGVRGKKPSFASGEAAAQGPPPAAIDFTHDQLEDPEILPPVRPISHDDPLRVWMGGDSHVGVVGGALGEILGSTGVVSLTNDYRVSSGLLGGPRDWIDYAPGSLAAVDPEVAIFMIGTNDAVIWSSADTDTYRERVTAMMDILSDGGNRLVLWVGTPTLGVGDANDEAQEINAIVRELADARPEVIYVDAFDLFDDGGGGFTPDLMSLDGEVRRMRVGDGVHFTTAGGQHLASVLYAALDHVWRITEQAEPGRPIGFTTAAGSGCDGSCGTYGNEGGSDTYDGSYDDGATETTAVSATTAVSETSSVPDGTAAPTSTAATTTTTSTPRATTTTTAKAPTTTAAPPTTAPPPTTAASPTTATVTGDGAPGAP